MGYNASWSSLHNSCSTKVCAVLKKLYRRLLDPLEQHEKTLFACWISSMVNFLEDFFQVKIREAPNEDLYLPSSTSICVSARQWSDRVSELKPYPAASVMNTFHISESWIPHTKQGSWHNEHLKRLSNRICSYLHISNLEIQPHSRAALYL